ncbi:hypothetical protein OC835_003394 [Tilletia horrida]|nr:hypothetical protein OC835_003394 [Tilletia horrida]
MALQRKMDEIKAIDAEMIWWGYIGVTTLAAGMWHKQAIRSSRKGDKSLQSYLSKHDSLAATFKTLTLLRIDSKTDRDSAR